MFETQDLALAHDLLECIRFFNLKGWSPATSTNYSVRSNDKQKYIISRSGVDKSKFRLEDLIMINEKAEILPPFSQKSVKSSAETEIHTALYHRYPEINCVLHTHSVLGTTLSLSLQTEKHILFQGLEILKGLEGNSSHELIEKLPIVPNSQDMSDIIKNLEEYLTGKLEIHGFLIAGHGLYSWGKDIATAKRHVETFEFLFECLHAMRK